MGHPSTHMLEDTHTEPKDHTSRTSASSTRTELITGDLLGHSRSPSFSLHLGLSAHLAGNKALEVGWAQIPGAESWLGLQAWSLLLPLFLSASLLLAPVSLSVF